MSVGKTIRALRQAVGMNQKTLAERAGLGQGLVSRLETGEISDLQSGSVASLAGVLGVPTDALVGSTQPDLVLRRRNALKPKELAATINLVLPPEKLDLKWVSITVFQCKVDSGYVTHIGVKGLRDRGAESPGTWNLLSTGGPSVASALKSHFEAGGGEVSGERWSLLERIIPAREKE